MKERYKQAIVNQGNWNPMKECMKRAGAGEPITVAFLGGSITQGSLSGTPETCYAYLVYQWWVQKFPQAEITYINAGIGGTTSLFGAARAQRDVIPKHPDLVVVDFSVNDEPNEFFKETFEGLIRQLLSVHKKPAILILNNAYYDTGKTAEMFHNAIARYYELPCVSVKAGILPLIESGLYKLGELTTDNLHPNDKGHKLLAECIFYLLEEIFDNIDEPDRTQYEFPEPQTKNAFEITNYYQNYNYIPVLNSFQIDCSIKGGLLDLYKNGWTATKKGQAIVFEIKGQNIAIQYRQTICLPAPIAVAVIDGNEEHQVVLDANFKETWGDNLALEPVLINANKEIHTIEIRIVEAHEDDVKPFYLVGLVVA